jgi:hypothetical protein
LTDDDPAFVMGGCLLVTQTMGLLLAGASLFSLIDGDLWRFKSSMLGLLGDALQRRIDDYEARKKAPDEPIL